MTHPQTRQAARRLATALVVVLSLLVAFGATALPAAASGPEHEPAEQQFLELINEVRTGQGLQPLVVNTQLRDIARAWSDVMDAEDRLHHNPNLTQQYQGGWRRMGENVGYTTYPGTPVTQMVTQLHQAFVNSPGHYANIVGAFNQVGIGVTIGGSTMWVTVAFLDGPIPAAEPDVERVEPTVPAPEPEPEPVLLPTPPQAREAVDVSRRLLGDAAASHAVIGRADDFADALGGAGLAGPTAPLLLTPGPTAEVPDPDLAPEVAAELERILPDGGDVYLLGGTGAVSAQVEATLRAAGHRVHRLAGTTRIETAAAAAEAIVAETGEPSQILLARADHWADAVAGGAYAADRRVPVVLTGRDHLHPVAAAFLAAHPTADVVALGGTAALSDEVVAAAGARRVAGPDRVSTAIAIARELWGRGTGRPGDRFVLTPAYGDTGWAYSLAYAPWSAAVDGPQLLVGDEVPAPVAGYLRDLGYTYHQRTVTFDAASPVPDAVVDQLEALTR